AAVRSNRNVMNVVETWQRNDFLYGKRRKIANQYFRLGTQIRAIALDRGRLEDDARNIRAMLRRRLIFQHAEPTRTFTLANQRFSVKPPFSSPVRNAALFTADHPKRTGLRHDVVMLLCFDFRRPSVSAGSARPGCAGEENV